MSTSSSEKSSLVGDVLQELDLDQLDQAPAERPRRWLGWLVGLAALAILVAAGLVGLAGTTSGSATEDLITQPVRRGELLVTVTEDGNLESARNLDVKCEVAGGSMILSIVEDGKEIEEGDILVRLESSQLEDQINQQKISYEKARATYIQSQKDFEVAKISVQEYLEGTYRQEHQTLEANVTIAMESLRSAQNSLQHTERMARKGYVTPLQLETQQFAVERAKLDLASAETAREVLERFTKAKTLQDLESKRDTAEAKASSDKAAFELEEARLKRFEAQLEKCIIKAPKSGMVVYANEQGRGRFGSQQGADIKEGATVREQQNILRLPDLANMQVRVIVHESKIDWIRKGMKARIRIQDRDMHGTVFSVANQPEPTSFFSAAVKEYATVVKIDGEAKSLRPGMTAEVEILVTHLKDVVSVPVAALFERAGQTFCCVKKGAKVETRPVTLGWSNEKFVEVKTGLAEGELVVLNPRAVVGEVAHESHQPETIDVAKRFGAGTPADPGDAPPAARAGERRPAAEPGPGAPRQGPGAPRGEGPGGPPGAGSSFGPPGEGRMGGPPGEGGSRRPRMDFSQMDKNGDNKLSRDELPERMAERFDSLDTNHDGFIDQAELEAMRARFSAGRKNGGPGGSGGPDGPGGGFGPPQ